MDNAGPVDDSCKTRKKDSHTLIAAASDGSAVTGSNVIVLNAADDTECSLQCAVGWYDLVYGNKAPFLCAPNSTDRRSREGMPTYPISCTSACMSCVTELYCHAI